MPRQTIKGMSSEQSAILGSCSRKKIANLEDTIPLQVKTQKEVILTALKQHRSTIDGLITDIEQVQTLDELLPMMQTAAKNMLSTW